jgi:hypothetical protein
MAAGCLLPNAAVDFERTNEQVGERVSRRCHAADKRYRPSCMPTLKGEARRHGSAGTEASSPMHVFNPPATTPPCGNRCSLNLPNRRIRTRMSGGVGGGGREADPYPV